MGQWSSLNAEVAESTHWLGGRWGATRRRSLYRDFIKLTEKL